MAIYLTCKFCKNKEKEGMSDGTPACSCYSPVKDAPADKLSIPDPVEDVKEETATSIQPISSPVKRMLPKPQPIKEEAMPEDIIADDGDFFE